MDFESSNPEFLGVGWAFPVQLNNSSEVAAAAYEEDIRQAIHIILGTEPGERVMRPDFGAGLRGLVFETVNTTTKARIRQRVETTLIRWEPRIEVISIRVEADGPMANKLLIHIQYKVRRSNTFDNLVYPFYLVEAGGP